MEEINPELKESLKRIIEAIEEKNFSKCKEEIDKIGEEEYENFPKLEIYIKILSDYCDNPREYDLLSIYLIHSELCLHYLDNFEGAIKYLDQFSKYENQLGYFPKLHWKIISLLEKIKNDKRIELCEKINQALEKVGDILKALSIGDLDCENGFAHYTTPQVANCLLDKENPSKFRLNTIKNVNDPQEGHLLRNFLQQDSLSVEPVEGTFIGCFTFNHDCLNQFRLYGKDKEKEASGISIVLKNNFFKLDTELVDCSVRGLKENNYITEALSLRRCIYIEPDTNYIRIAHRNEDTFYRHYKEDAKDKWNEYIKKIKYNEKEVNRLFNRLKEIIKDLFEKFSEYKLEDNLSKVIDYLLLPLQFLVKHAAFQHEQECRIILITDITSNLIKSDFEKNLMYIEYQPEEDKNFSDYVKKIYLSPGAANKRDFFRRLLNDSDGEKVRESKNPFRT